jgi:phosphatidylglycerophosphate synthase
MANLPRSLIVLDSRPACRLKTYGSASGLMALRRRATGLAVACPPTRLDFGDDSMSSGILAEMRKFPNQLTAIRFAAVPAMWVCALLSAKTWLAVGYAVGLVTDLFDGIAARRLHQTSDFGSKFDSAADQFLQLSSVAWILILMPEIIVDNWLISLVSLLVYIGSLAVGLVKFRQLANLHLFMSKAGGFFLYVFLIHTYSVGQYDPWLFALAMGLFLLSSLETLLLQLTTSNLDAEYGSILFRYLDEDHPIRRSLARLP